MVVNPDSKPEKPRLQLAYESAGPGGPGTKTAIGLAQEPEDFDLPGAAPKWFAIGYSFFLHGMMQRFQRLPEEMQLTLMKDSKIPRWHRQVLMWRWKIVTAENLTSLDSARQLENYHFSPAKFSQGLDRVEIEAAWCLWKTKNWQRGVAYY